MGITRNNHFVPQVYLKNFAASDGSVAMYRTLVSHSEVPEWERVNVAGTAYHRDLYTRIADGEESDEIEQWMNREFETPAQEPLQKVRLEQQLNASDWHKLVRFLALQAVRTPAFFLDSLDQWDRIMPGVLEETARDAREAIRLARESGREVVLGEVPHAGYFPMRIDREDFPEEETSRITTTVLKGRGLWFYSMKYILTESESLKALHRHKWNILESPSRLEWFTSDNPVVKLNIQSRGGYNFGGGWGSFGTYILFPLDPSHLMYTRIGAEPGFRTPTPSRYHARFIRRVIAAHAFRHVFCRIEEAKVRELRPRAVDAEAFGNEKKFWDAWHEEETRREQEVLGTCS